MANYKVTDSELTGIADVIRLKGGTSDPLVFPSGFASAIEAIQAGFSAADEGKVVASGALVPQGSMSILSNGSYDTTLYSDINVAIPGAMLMSKVFSENGVYNASADNVDGYSQVTVSVSGGGGGGLPDFILTGESGALVDNTLSQIGPYAMYSHQGLTSVFLGQVVNVMTKAFNECHSLSRVELPECLSIGSDVFSYCSKLQYVSLPKCQTIENNAFYNCQSLASISLPECTTLKNMIFSSCSRLAEVYAPKVTTVGTSAFYKCSKLQSVFMPSCTTIGASGFFMCSSIQTINIAACTTLGSNALNGLASLQSLTLENLTTADDGAFQGCTNLSYLSLPKLSIGSTNLFRNCSKLESLYLLNETMVTRITGNYVSFAFSSTPFISSTTLGRFGSIFVPSSLVSEYKSVWSLVSDRITAYEG